jgi:hypothetical protein
MALLVQDDQASVAEANGYISIDYMRNYWSTRGNELMDYTDDQLAVGIVLASSFLDTRFIFVGIKLRGRDQSTEWPRSSVWDRDRFYVNGIPPEIKKATAEYALRALTMELNPDPERSAAGVAVQSKSETVGPISESTTYVSGAVFTMPKYPAADQKLIRAGFVRAPGTVARA